MIEGVLTIMCIGRCLLISAVAVIMGAPDGKFKCTTASSEFSERDAVTVLVSPSIPNRQRHRCLRHANALTCANYVVIPSIKHLIINMI